jgi:hypothetical protein
MNIYKGQNKQTTKILQYNNINFVVMKKTQKIMQATFGKHNTDVIQV